MYIDLVVVVVLIIVAFAWFRKFSKAVYAIAIIDIFLRLLGYISKNIGIPEFHKWVKSIFPTSIPGMLSQYMGGVLLIIFIWIYTVIMAIFLFYVVRTFLKKR